MLDEKIKKETASSVTRKIISRLSNSLETSSSKAILADLRNSIGRPLSTSIEIWPLLYEYMPEEFLSTSGKTTAEELAILTTLQFYATHQQGKSENVNLSDDEAYYNNIGYSLSFLRIEDDTVSVDRRFNAMITSTNFDELVHHLRQMIKLLKSKTTAKINYPLLANDLYWFIRGYEENTRLRWARQYYGRTIKGDNTNAK